MGARVLVVDDESYIRELIRETLRGRQYKAGTAANGVEALDTLSRETYDILVTDVVMPGMEGLELVKQVRRLYPKVHIIVLTGFPRSADIGDFLAQGVDEFLPKPFRGNDLIAVIRRLEEKMAGSSGGGPAAPGTGASGPGASGPGAPGPGASGPGASGPGAPGPGAAGGPGGGKASS